MSDLILFPVGMVQLDPLKKKETQPDVQPSLPEVCCLFELFVTYDKSWQVPRLY